MKTNQRVATTAAVTLICTLASTHSHAQGNSGNSAAPRIPAVPVGVLSASPSVVQTGTKPTLTWNILYPSKVSDVATIIPPGSIFLSQNMYVSVQPISANLTASSGGQSVSALSSDARISVNGSDYQQLFYGTQEDVDPSYSLYIKKHSKNTTIDFGGRYVENGGWSDFYTTKSSNLQVISLVKGDVPPTSFSLSQSSNLAGSLAPYLDASGKVDIGPMSVLIMMELDQNDPASSSFDYQDQVLLVTFSTKHPNNGHGNNLDGVDVSNPGRGSGGPNGEVDPSGGVDDEAK